MIKRVLAWLGDLFCGDVLAAETPEAKRMAEWGARDAHAGLETPPVRPEMRRAYEAGQRHVENQW